MAPGLPPILDSFWVPASAGGSSHLGSLCSSQCRDMLRRACVGGGRACGGHRPGGSWHCGFLVPAAGHRVTPMQEATEFHFSRAGDQSPSLEPHIQPGATQLGFPDSCGGGRASAVGAGRCLRNRGWIGLIWCWDVGGPQEGADAVGFLARRRAGWACLEPGCRLCHECAPRPAVLRQGQPVFCVCAAPRCWSAGPVRCRPAG